MAHLAHAVPTEEEEADKGGFEEEGHQPLDRQRRAEDVAHIVAIIAPVHTELEFHDDAGGHAHCKVDAEKRAPENRGLAPDFAARHHVDAFHHGHQHG